MEGRVCSDFYRNTSEEFFIRSLMENSVGIPAAPTMEIMGFKNLSNGFRADSEELFKSWLITGENQGHNSTSVVHNRPRQLSRMLVDQANLPSHQNGIPPQNISIENPTPESLSAVNETSFGINENSVRNLAERGLPANNLYLAKAWFNSSQPMTRSRSSELRRKYVAMQNSQTTFGIEAMHNALVNQLKQEFVNPNAFNSSSMCDIITPFNDVMSTSNSLSPTFNTPQIDKVSSVVSMLKNTLQRKKLSPNVEKETIVKSLGYYGAQDEEHGRVFHDLTAADISDHVLVQGFEGAMMDADMEGFVAPTSQSESSAAAPVISTGFDVSDGLSNSGQSPSVCQSPRKQVGYGKSKENGCTAKDIRERMHDIRKEDHKNNERLSRHGSVTSAASGDPTKKRRVERSRKMAEAKERTQTPATSSDMQSILKRCENLEKEVRSLKLNLAFMNRKDSEQTKQIEELQKQNEDMGDEKERLLEEIERILSRQDKKY